jgi:hypothetical protein
MANAEEETLMIIIYDEPRAMAKIQSTIHSTALQPYQKPVFEALKQLLQAPGCDAMCPPSRHGDSNIMMYGQQQLQNIGRDIAASNKPKNPDHFYPTTWQRMLFNNNRDLVKDLKEFFRGNQEALQHIDNKREFTFEKHWVIQSARLEGIQLALGKFITEIRKIVHEQQLTANTQTSQGSHTNILETQ